MSSNQSSNSKATSRKEPAPVSQFPLQAGTALKIVNDLATNFKSRVRFSGHCRDRMKERGIRERDIFNVLKSKRSQIDEGPAQQPSGDWKFKVIGVSCGERISVVIALKDVEIAAKATTVTVFIESF